MAKFLRIWSGIFAAFFLVGETFSNIAVNGKPISILLPYYVVSALLIGGLFSPGYGAKLLVLGWGVALGYSFVAFADNLALFLGDERLPDVTAIADKLGTTEDFVRPPAFLLVGLGVFVVATLIGLGAAYYCCHVNTLKSPSTHGALSVRLLTILSGVFAVSVAAGQLFTSWGGGRPMTVLLAYYLIAGCLATAIFFYRVRPQLLLSAWCVAFGFFYAEFTGFLVFYERPAWVLRLAVAAVGASLLGLLLAFRALTLLSSGSSITPGSES